MKAHQKIIRENKAEESVSQDRFGQTNLFGDWWKELDIDINFGIQCINIDQLGLFFLFIAINQMLI